MSKLNYFSKFSGRKGPLLLVIMDGVGLNESEVGNAVKAATTPVLDELMANHMMTQLRAHGTAVGLPSDNDMGNSEVGHNAIGAGRVFEQGAKLVNAAIETGALWQGGTWKKLIKNTLQNSSTLHFIGLFSDGNVHSHIDHLKAMLNQAKDEGVKKVRIHILLDGRDVGETSALEYVRPFETFLSELNNSGVDYRIASGGGRMIVTMDRYEADWEIVQRGWLAHIQGDGVQSDSTDAAITLIRDENPGITDQYLLPFVIGENGQPIGPIQDGDSVIFFNFRGDRAIEISRAFEDSDFDKFDRGMIPNIEYAGMMEYDGDLHIPKQYLVEPPAIDNTMGELLSHSGVTQLAISETQKYGHVTYFFNGNWSGKFDKDLETYIEVPSDNVPFDQKPKMKAKEITDRLLEEMKTGKYRFARVNFANGDMVGHTGVFDAAVIGVEAVDEALGRILPVIKEMGGVALITADHGNADEMYELDKEGNPKTENGRIKPRTSHTLNPVPFIFYDPSSHGEYRLADVNKPGLSNIAATCMQLLGFEPPEEYDSSLVEFE
ncbi:2,3-bisphosphoglycerate-independent phosphoglycerate mutase [candidate division KSB1 bacterium]|nr:2,3-bisphosphoglycerate-independent phosphoglycerate mutase [candidate division KSB1 bacterium]